MSRKYIGGIVIKNPTAPTTSAAKGIWTLDDVSSFVKQGLWPRSPGAPTIGTATVSGTTASVPFTTPGELGAGAITYTATSNPGSITATGTSPISVTGLTGGTSYTFTVRAATPGGTGPASAASNSVSAEVIGQQAFTTAGSFTWVAPAGVTSVSVVAVGSGGNAATGAGGGGLGYKNNITVTPGNSYPVVVGAIAVANNTAGADSYFCSTSVVKGGGGGSTWSVPGTYTGDGGGNGGQGGGQAYGGGGGAGGYSGDGGRGAQSCNAPGSNGSGGGGGGGGGSNAQQNQFNARGGGVGILGQGANGTGGSSSNNSGTTPTDGTAGSGGSGVTYGGTGKYNVSSGSSPGGVGAVRIIYPGTTRTFPSTNTGDL